MLEQPEQMKSIRQLADELRTNHTQIRRVMQSLGIAGQSQGSGKPTLLSPDEQEQIAQKITPSALAKLPSHSVEVLPENGYGKNFDMGSSYELHLHIHTSHKSQYQQQEQLTDSNIQALLNQALSTRFEQGQEDQQEVDSIIQAAKSKLIEAGIAGLTVRPGKSQ